MKTFVIGDIHGEYDCFIELLNKLSIEKEDQLILLGDYIDRGPDSNKVVQKVMDLQKEGAVVLRGNHEEMMLEALQGEDMALARWYKNGGEETIKSYTHQDNLKIPDTDEFNHHVEFIKNLDYFYETNDYIFVHAGITPGKTPNDTAKHDLVWIREDFHNNYCGKKTVIFGHTPTPYLHNKKDTSAYFGNNNIIGIDGALVFGGQLHCLILPEQKIVSVKK